MLILMPLLNQVFQKRRLNRIEGSHPKLPEAWQSQVLPANVKFSSTSSLNFYCLE